MKNKIAIVLIYLIFPVILFAQTNDYNLSNVISFDGEPSIAINPTNSDNIISGWMRLRLDGRMWIAARSSFDGGATWSTHEFMPHVDTAYSSADVSITFHNSGIAYLSYVDIDWSDTTATVFVSKSLNGGLLWETPVPVFLSNEIPERPFDRPWIAVDNSGGVNDGAIYVTTMSVYFDTILPHHVYLKTSTDGGSSWSNIIQVDDNLHSVGSLEVSWGTVSVGGDGKAYIGYYSYDTNISPFLCSYVAITENLGTSFNYSLVSNIYLTANASYNNGYVLSADPSSNNRVMMAWIDDRFGEADVVQSLSIDGGITWSSPERINDDVVGNGVIQDRVWAKYASDGTLVLAWRDRRLNGAGTSVPADIYLAYSNDGGNSYGLNYLMSSSSAPHTALPCCNSFLDVSSNNNSAFVVWGEDRSSDWEVYINSTPLTYVGINTETQINIVEMKVFPNPAINTIHINFQLDIDQKVTLEIFDTSGKHLDALLNEQLEAGEHSINTDNFKLTQGTYILKLTGKEFISQKLLVITN